MTTGLSVDGAGFEVLCGNERVGPRRLISPDDVTLLAGLAGRYVRAVQARSDSGVLIALGRELYAWLDGDAAQLTTLLGQARSPVVFEIRGPGKPTAAAWAVLRAPFELLAGPDGFLAGDALTRFCVARRLGTPAADWPAPDDYRLGLAFMASSPRGVDDLDYEAEETAILRAVGESRIDLIVDDTGDPEQLAGRLAAVRGMSAVHLSCHGHNSWPDPKGGDPRPVLLMETDDGAPRPTTAANLAELLTTTPRLLFVSACLTAAAAGADHLPPGNGHKTDPAKDAAADAAPGPGDLKGASAGGGRVAHSLATALIEAGLPAVLGWDGSVNDRAATVFAGHLYAALAKQADLAVAVGDARRALLNADYPHLRADWHLARLWLGPEGGGPIIVGTRKRSLVTATHGTKRFLKRKQQRVPVASAEMFVGRRHELQQALRALRALRSADRTGVLLHGQGRLGKSSLAARLADRLPGYAPAVVFGDYSALGILDAIAEAVTANPEARDLIKRRLPEVRQDPGEIEPVLVDLLTGPCAQPGEHGQRPLLLIIDDLEQILVPDPDGPHRVATHESPDQPRILSGVLRAFDLAETDSRLLLTSRYTFTLNGLEASLAEVQLRPLSGVAQHKLQRRQRLLTAQSATGQTLAADRSALADRAVAVSRGNPGLQDLIVMRIVYNREIPADRAESAVASMEEYLSQGALPAEPEIRGFLENLALDTLLEEAGEDNKDLLRAATLFDLPVPVEVIDVLAAQVGGAVSRLRGLGLLDPSCLALRVNPLAAGRLAPLTDSDRATLATLATAPLFAAWGGEAGWSARDRTLDLQLTRLALLSGNPAVVASCAADAVKVLRDGPAAIAAKLAQAAIELLDRLGRAVPVELLREAADAALTCGDGEKGEALLGRAVNRVQADDSEGISSLAQARVIVERARHLITQGELDQAEQLLRRAWQLFTVGGSEGEAAVAMGSIADIAYRRGELDEALRIRREVELPVFERLGDVREAAVTWGRVADIAFDRSDYDDAAQWRRKVLEACEQLGAIDGIATAEWGLARIDLARQDYESALPRLFKSYQLFDRLGSPNALATVGRALGELLLAANATDEAREVLGGSREAAAKIRWTGMVQRIDELLNSLPPETEGS